MTKIHVNSFVKRQTPESEFSHFSPDTDNDPWEFLENMLLGIIATDLLKLSLPGTISIANVDEETLVGCANVKRGYRDGVILVNIPFDSEDSHVWFYSGVTTLEEGTTLEGSFKARREGEEPRKSVHARRVGASAHDNCSAHACPKPSAFAGIAWKSDMSSVRCTECAEKFHDTVAEKLPAKSVEIVLYASTLLGEDGDNELPAEEGNWEVISVNANPCEGVMPINPDVLMHNHFGSDGGTETGLSDEDFVKMLRESFLFWKDKAMLAPKEKK